MGAQRRRHQTKQEKRERDRRWADLQPAMLRWMGVYGISNGRLGELLGISSQSISKWTSSAVLASPKEEHLNRIEELIQAGAPDPRSDG